MRPHPRVPLPRSGPRLSSRGTRAVEAVIFDLDGVLTDTATLHRAAWKQLFDAALSAHRGAAPYTDQDYYRYVDGRRRSDGVVAVLASRRIELPAGDEDDPPERETVAALAKRKDGYYLRLLRELGPRTFPSSLALLRALRRQRVKIALVSGSRHAGEVLAAAGIAELFDARVDGVEAQRLQLAGKPDPATFLEAARRLGVEAAEAAVVEDSIAGIEAARRGHFGMVVGVDRRGEPAQLREAGADLVVGDLGELSSEPAGPHRVRLHAPAPGHRAPAIAAAESSDRRTGWDEIDGSWRWTYLGYDPALEGLRETLCTLGNGYVATRGTAAEAAADDIHYPGTYVAGCYNRLETDLMGEGLEIESMVNLPNWLDFRFRIGGSDWFRTEDAQLIGYRQEVDLREGVLYRNWTFEDHVGHRTAVGERRIVSYAHPHLAAHETTITPENWSGTVLVRCGLDGRVTNTGVRADRGFNGQHLTNVAVVPLGSDGVELTAETSQSGIRIAEACRIGVSVDGVPSDPDRSVLTEPRYIGQEMKLPMSAGRPTRVEKLVALYTSRDPAVSEPREAARRAVHEAGCFDELLPPHRAAWARSWARFHFQTGNPEHTQALRLHAFHLLQTLSRHTMELDVGVPARGLHGEGYRGHVFWDEVFVLPLLNFRFPELTRELIRYRYRRLPAARERAAEIGCAGALFPWQCGSDGREETPAKLFNPRSGRWIVDNSRLQRHVNLAVAYNIWHYYEVTGDIEFLASYGGELLIEIARFFSSLAVFNQQRGRYEIRGVMGPDEYHDAYPRAHEPGIDNNAYTNVMTVWLLRTAIDVLTVLHGYHCDELMATLQLEEAELDRWSDICSKMFVPFHADGVISQFEGYDQLLELDWESYRRRYGNIGRLDLILEAENDTPNRYKLSKQADVLMLLYLLSVEEVRDILASLGYALPAEAVVKTVDYYLARTSHGSTLSRVVDAWILARSDRRRSWAYFSDALAADVADAQGATTAEGVHLGAMAATLDILQRCYTGLEARDGVLWLNPMLPPDLGSIELDLLYRGQWINLGISTDRLRVAAEPCSANPIRVGFGGRIVEIRPGDVFESEIRGAKPNGRTNGG